LNIAGKTHFNICEHPQRFTFKINEYSQLDRYLRTKKGDYSMESRTFYYARVSSREQHLDRQIAAFHAIGAQEREIITDKESGKDLNRSGYTALKTALLRRGDTLVIKSLDRLSRNKNDIKNELQHFKEAGIRVKVLDLPTTLTEYPEGQEWVLEMVNNILIEVLASIAEQERTTIKQRQAEGIAAAKEQGKHLGRPTLVCPDNWNEVYKSWKAGEITAKTAMERTGTKRTSFYKLAAAMA
jgi:DNA invertase Pin-like site-specific DNA recombinase